MAIYRPRRSRWPLLVAVALAGIVLGFGAGAVVVGTRPADLPGAARAIAAELSASAELLEVGEIEYQEAAAAAFSGTEHQAALENVSRSRAHYDTVGPALSVLDAERAARIEAGFASLQQLIESHADPAEVHVSVQELRAALQP